MASLRIVGAANVSRVADNLGKRALLLRKRTAQAMERVVKSIEREVKVKGLGGSSRENSLFGKIGAAPGSGQLSQVTGTARKTLVSRVFTQLTKVVGVVGTPLAYVAMHEFGGEVRGNPLLRIPTKFSKKNSGQDRLQGRSARTLGDKARAWRSRAGNLFVWEIGTARAKAAGRPIPLYLLKPSVTLKKRGMFKRALRANRNLIRNSFRGLFASARGGV